MPAIIATINGIKRQISANYNLFRANGSICLAGKILPQLKGECPAFLLPGIQRLYN